MKKNGTSLCLALVVFLCQNLYSQGKFAGSFRSLVGKTYQDKKQLPILNGFVPQGTLLNDNFRQSWYSKGNLALILLEEISKDGFSVRDAIEISNFSTDQTIQSGNCQKVSNASGRTVEDESLIAVVQKNDFNKVLRAWRLNFENKNFENLEKGETVLSCFSELSGTLKSIAAPAWQPSVNKIFKDTNDIPELKGYTMRDIAPLYGNIEVIEYSKANGLVLVFNLKLPDNYKFVIDIIETSLAKTQDVRAGLCKELNFDNPFVVAVVEKSKNERWNAAKAWMFDNRVGVKEIPAKDVTCVGDMGDAD